MRISNLVLLILLSATCHAQALRESAEQKIIELTELITEAEEAGISTEREKLAIRTSEIFLDYADWDENNKTLNIAHFEAGWHYKDNATEMANLLPDFERQDVIDLLEESLEELQSEIDGDIDRPDVIDVDWSALTMQNDELCFLGQPVFLADWTWKPESSKYWDYHGQLDGFYISPGYVTSEQGAVNTNQLSNLQSKGSGTAGFIFMNNRNPPQWAKDKYGDEFIIKDAGNVRYTDYDIDHPGAKELIGDLIEGFVPEMAGKNFSMLGYMLCNEPHFITSKKANGQPSWAGTGVSSYSMERFKDSLKSKHGSIGNLNAIWNTNFVSFDDLSLEVPMSVSMRGTPQWYDWMRFNMDRVTNWFEWMGTKVKESDPHAKVHLKLIPGQWTGNERDHGLDFEALTRMSDIIGNDAGAAHRSAPWKTEEWEEDYIFDWREMAMGYDFFKSIHPKKMMFNTETHFLSTKRSINLWLDPMHTRATYWMATTLGMSASQTWYWSRREDGSARNQSDTGYGGSNNHQPRVTNAVHATMMDLNTYGEEIMKFQRLRKPVRIFYSETSAINKEHHMDDLFELYESMFFEGIPIGFVTEDILRNDDSGNWDAVLVYKSEFIKESELDAIQSYVDEGGKVFKDAVSLAKNEYGADIEPLNGATNVEGVDGMKTVALQNVNLGVKVIETSEADHPICTWRVVDGDSGNKILSIVNVGKVDAEVTLRIKNPVNGTSAKDLLKGIDIPTTNILAPYEVLFVELRDEVSSFEEKILGLDEDDAFIFPNPTKGLINLRLGEEFKTGSIRVLDLNGRLIHTESIEDSAKCSFDFSEAKPGMYILQIQQGHAVNSYRFVKL